MERRSRFGPRSKIRSRRLDSGDCCYRNASTSGLAVCALTERFRSQPERFVHEPRYLAAVRTALGLAHHVADDRADRLGVARSGPARRHRRWRCSAAATISFSSLPPSSAPSPSAATIARGSPPSASSRSRTWRAAPTLTRRGAHESDESGERAGARREAPGSSPSSEPRDQVDQNPVRERLWARRGVGLAHPRPPRRSRPARLRKASWRELSGVRENSRSSRSRAGGGQLGQGLAGGLEHRLVDRDRNEVGLGKVAVVVGFLLGAQRCQAAARGIEMQRLLRHLSARPRGSPPGGRSRP